MKISLTVNDLPKLFFQSRSKIQVNYRKIQCIVKAYPYPSAAVSVSLLITLVLLAIPHEGKILPVEPQVVAAYSLLGKTETGKELIKRVKKHTKGSFIYLSLGSTEKDKLVTIFGDTVRGVTRSTFEYYDRFRLPKSVTVITNRDLVGTAPRDIVRSIAFELENVSYSFQHPQVDFPADSPRAFSTQRRVMKELEM